MKTFSVLYIITLYASKINEGKKQYKITFGGWYQRTTLHLSEIHGFLESGFTKLPLSQAKLKIYRNALKLSSVERHTDLYEYVLAQTSTGIEIVYYEDGLYILNFVTNDVQNGRDYLKDYFERIFEPAIKYIFSLGAPTQKVLANITSIHPTVVSIITKTPHDYIVDENVFGKVYQTVSSENIVVYKTHEYIIICAKREEEKKLQDIVETQIFFREFKDQLEKYLYIHRTLWEEITEIKERRFIRGYQVEKTKQKLDAYKKTTDLISNRINQMENYSATRGSIAQKLEIEPALSDLFQYRFKVLSDTHAYIKELWNMTDKYLTTGIQNIADIRSQTINRSITSLQIITTIGVIVSIYGYISRTEFQPITSAGIKFFGILLIVTWCVNFLVLQLFRLKTYKLGFPEEVKI